MARLTIKPKVCKGCGICVEFCPKKVLELDEYSKIKIGNEENCVSCGQCGLRCPDYAIYLVDENSR